MKSETETRSRAINREIMRLTLPTVLSNISVPLLAMCDTAVAGHMDSDKFIAGVALGSVMMSAVFWLFSFLRAGTSGITASAYGSQDATRMVYALLRSAVLGIFIAIVVFLFQKPLLSLLNIALGASSDATELSQRYFSIAMWGAIPMMILMALSGWFVGMQSTKTAMIVNIALGVLNVAFTLILVYPCRLGFDGIVVGTVIAQWIILFPAFGMVAGLFKKNDLRFSWKKSLFFDAREWKMMFGVNSNLFFRSACLIAATMSMYAFSARLGDSEVGANAVINQLFLFFSYFMDGFAYTGEAIIGRWNGSGDHLMMRRYIAALIKWGAVVTLLFSLFYLLALPQLTSMLSDSANVAASVENCKIWIFLIPIAGAGAFIFDGFYIGLTRTRPMLISTLSGVALFIFLLFSFADTPWMLWMAFTSYLALRSAILIGLFPSNLKRI